MSFDLDLRDNVQRTLYFTGWYERRYLELLLREVRRGDTYVDVGAHVGIHALLVARRLERLGGGRVVAFEASPEIAAGLEAAVARNGLVDVSVVSCALSDSADTIDMHSDPQQFDPFDAAVLSRVGPGPVVARAPSVTFDSWRAATNLERVDIVKIDVEGDELRVLRGMRETLECLKPRLIGVEVRGYILERAAVSAGEVHAELARAGYDVSKTPDLEANFLFRPRTRGDA